MIEARFNTNPRYGALDEAREADAGTAADAAVRAAWSRWRS